MNSFAANSDRDRVLDATDLVAVVGEHVALKPKGREHVGLCPFHDDRSPSFAVVSHKGTPFYKCFACGVGGNAIDFVMNFHKMSFVEALKYLASRAGIELSARPDHKNAGKDSQQNGVSKEDLLRANQLALKFYRRLLADPTEGAVAREVIAKRRIAPAMVEAFQLGYAPDRRDGIETALQRATQLTKETGREAPPPLAAFLEAGVVRSGSYGRSDLLRHRLVFPICDELGRPIAFGGRKIRDEDEPKYINSPESPVFHKSKSLYGLHLAKQSIVKSGVAVVTEGYTDVIACHAAGVTNVVATLGTALTREHARLLRRLCSTVILLFDGDAAGLRAADRGVEVFFQETIDVKVCALPDDLDPDELLSQPDGVARFNAALAGSVDALTFLVRRFRADYVARNGISGRQQALEALLAKLVSLGFAGVTGVRKQMILPALATLTGLSESDIKAALPAARPVTRLAESTNDESSVVEEPSLTGPPISRARRAAEEHLLALLLANPSAAQLSVTVTDPDGSDASDAVPLTSHAGPSGSASSLGATTLPLVEACPPSMFQDPGFQEIYRTWHDCVEAGQSPTFQLVLAELADSRRKGLASDLYLLGEKWRERDERATLERIRIAYGDLERRDRRERSASRRDFGYQPDSSTTLASLEEAARGSELSDAESSSDEPSPPISETPSFPAPLTTRSSSPSASVAAQARLQSLIERGPDVTRFPKRVRSNSGA